MRRQALELVFRDDVSYAAVDIRSRVDCVNYSFESARCGTEGLVRPHALTAVACFPRSRYFWLSRGAVRVIFLQQESMAASSACGVSLGLDFM